MDLSRAGLSRVSSRAQGFRGRSEGTGSRGPWDCLRAVPAEAEAGRAAVKVQRAPAVCLTCSGLVGSWILTATL